MHTSELLRPFWKQRDLSLFATGILFALVLASFRAAGMLGGGGWQVFLPVGFVIMTLLPFVFLNKAGRTAIGFQSANRFSYYITSVIMGGGAAVICFVAGVVLFGYTDDNWFVTIRNSYVNNPGYQPQAGLFQQFLFFTIPALIFSPIGEEIFFRGFLQQALTERMGASKASVVDASFFGVVHIVHHGIVNQSGQLMIYPSSGMIWILLMTGTAWMLGWIRKLSGSLYPAMLAHACFNGVMNYLIFYHIK